MDVQLREVIGAELRRRHRVGLMEGKLKPVHIANALMREEHRLVGRTAELKNLMTATAQRESPEQRLAAVTKMLERNRERWGRLADDKDPTRSVLMTRVLPLLRTILGTDGAAFGASPDFSSFSSPTALTVTRDASDDYAGELVHHLWGGHDLERRLGVLDLLHKVTDPDRKVADVDDLTAVLLPLAGDRVPWRGAGRGGEPDAENAASFSEVEQMLREAARDLLRYELALKSNPIATLERIVLLASLTVFFYVATRSEESVAAPPRVMLLDASNARNSTIAAASEQSVQRLLADARRYMARVLVDLLDAEAPQWAADPETGLRSLFQARLKKHSQPSSYEPLLNILADIADGDGDVVADLPGRLVDLLDSSSGRSLDAFLRLLGVRCGLLYPQQKNPVKRLVPTDRTLEVIVASTFDVSGPPLEYRDFLDLLYRRWRILAGGRLEDAALLATTGTLISNTDLSDNSKRLLARLQALGLARALADSVAVVGLMEESTHVAP